MIESEKYRLIRRTVKEFAKHEVAPLADKIEETGKIPEELYRKMADNQYFGVTIPKQYGGCGAGYVAMAIVMEELAKASVSATLYVTSPNTLLGLPILNYGTEEQKQKYLVPVMKGEKEGTFALTEPSAGSDAATQNTIARKDGDYYIISGRKSFITAAPLCDFAVIFAATDTAAGAKGITAFIVERDSPGYSVGQPERKMGVNGSPTADIILENVRVHKSQILGEEGNAFQMAMRTLDSGRLVVASQCLGIAEAAMEEAVKYVKQRRQFGQALAKFQGIQFMLADMETKLCCARALIYDAAEKKDAGMNITKEAAAAKYFASEMCNDIAAKALQLHGAYGYVKDYPIERIFRDARVTTIYEGTSQILQTVIAKQVLKGQ